jgi:hypothetical protein
LMRALKSCLPLDKGLFSFVLISLTPKRLWLFDMTLRLKRSLPLHDRWLIFGWNKAVDSSTWIRSTILFTDSFGVCGVSASTQRFRSNWFTFHASYVRWRKFDAAFLNIIVILQEGGKCRLSLSFLVIKATKLWRCVSHVFIVFKK